MQQEKRASCGFPSRPLTLMAHTLTSLKGHNLETRQDLLCRQRGLEENSTTGSRITTGEAEQRALRMLRTES